MSDEVPRLIMPPRHKDIKIHILNGEEETVKDDISDRIKYLSLCGQTFDGDILASTTVDETDICSNCQRTADLKDIEYSHFLEEQNE